MKSVEQVTRPGIYAMPQATYLADPVPGGSLSASGARKLLPPSCPALFAYEREHRPAPSSAMSFGTVAHALVLGDGPDLVVVDADDWRSKAARDERAEAEAAGKTVILAGGYQTVVEMAAALKEHPIAGPLLDPARGDRERSLFWVDGPSGVWRRARLDLLPHAVPGRRTVLADYKTAASAEPEKFARTAIDYGYHLQASWYMDAVRAVRSDPDVAFVFIVQEKTPPYLVSVIELGGFALRIGEWLSRRAITTYKQCVESGKWPGYADDVALVNLPGWYENRMEEEYGR